MIRVLAESNINIVSDHVSTAILDGEISDDEFYLIVCEITKYNQIA